MNHRVKNLFALSGSIVGLSARTAKTPKDLAGSVQERLSALARAHELTLKKVYGAPDMHATSLHALIRTLTAPYENAGSGGTRIAIAGPDLTIGASALTNLALLLHEFATNAAKYGALSVSRGRIDIACRDEGEVFVLDWTERGGPPVQATSEEGFGTLIGKVTVKGQLNGEIVKEWNPEGLRIRLSISRERVSD
jgi:two-component sensor histidine kinase